VIDIPDFIQSQGGVEEIRLAKLPSNGGGKGKRFRIDVT